MKLLTKTNETICYYQIDIEGEEYIFKEYLDESGKVFEDELLNGSSEIVDNEELLERVRQFVDDNTSYYQ